MRPAIASADAGRVRGEQRLQDEAARGGDAETLLAQDGEGALDVVEAPPRSLGGVGHAALRL